jgi:predicted site-specific integrase-resolvase
MSPLSTEEVAGKVGVNRVTLERWLSSGKLKPPKTVRFGRNEFRDWTDTDVERVRKFKQENYCKGRGRKPKSKR